MNIDFCITLQQKLWHLLGELRQGKGKRDTDLSLCLFGSFPPYLTHTALTNTASVLTGKSTNNHSSITWSCCKTPYGLLNLTVVHLSRDIEEKTAEGPWVQSDFVKTKREVLLERGYCTKVYVCVCACVHTHACMYLKALKHLLLPKPKLECSGKDNLIFSFWIHFSDGNFNTSWGESISGYVHQMQQ